MNGYSGIMTDFLLSAANIGVKTEGFSLNKLVGWKNKNLMQ